MCQSVQSMREFVCDRLTAAAQDILGAFESRIQEYEREVSRQRRLLERVRTPENQPHHTELLKTSVLKRQCDNEKTPGLVCLGPYQLKEEPEEVFIDQEGQQVRDTEAINVTPSSDVRDYRSEPFDGGQTQTAVNKGPQCSILTENPLSGPGRHTCESQGTITSDHGSTPNKQNESTSQQRPHEGSDKWNITEVKSVEQTSNHCDGQNTASVSSSERNDKNTDNIPELTLNCEVTPINNKKDGFKSVTSAVNEVTKTCGNSISNKSTVLASKEKCSKLAQTSNTSFDVSEKEGNKNLTPTTNTEKSEQMPPPKRANEAKTSAKSKDIRLNEKGKNTNSEKSSELTLKDKMITVTKTSTGTKEITPNEKGLNNTEPFKRTSKPIPHEKKYRFTKTLTVRINRSPIIKYLSNRATTIPVQRTESTQTEKSERKELTPIEKHNTMTKTSTSKEASYEKDKSKTMTTTSAEITAKRKHKDEDNQMKPRKKPHEEHSRKTTSSSNAKSSAATHQNHSTKKSERSMTPHSSESTRNRKHSDGKTSRSKETTLCTKQRNESSASKKSTAVLPNKRPKEKELMLSKKCNKKSAISSKSKEGNVDNDKNSYKCDKCCKVWTSLKKYNFHMKSHTSDKSFKCHICGRMFRDRSDLSTHLVTHAPEHPFKCDECGKGFNRHASLKQHLRTHTGERPFHCTHCDKSFIGKLNLTRHTRVHTGEKPYVCSYCRKDFSSHSAYRIHLRIHTGERPFKCTYCTTRCRSSTDLKKHVRSHTGEKPYKCKLCDKTFSHNSFMNVHLRLHSGEKRYKCKVCAEQFSSWVKFAAHRDGHTNYA